MAFELVKIISGHRTPKTSEDGHGHDGNTRVADPGTRRPVT